jgi:hypothetical protein
MINLRIMRWAGACIEETVNAYKFLARVSEWKKPLGRPKRR